MLRSIVKSIKYLIILIGIILLVPSCLYLIIRIPEVQTFIVQRITSSFSDQIKSRITIGRIEYSFFNKLTINDLLIKDMNNDTMVYSTRVLLGIRSLDFRNKVIRFGQAELDRPQIALITDSTGVMNLKWYLDMFGKTEGDGKKKSTTISINSITINEGKFALLNKTGEKSDMLMDFHNLRISGINGTVDDLKIQNDTTSFGVSNLGFLESNGFLVKKLNSDVIISGHSFLFNNLFLDCDSSVINAYQVGIVADSSDSFERFAGEVRLNFDLQKSLVSSADLSYFIPFLNGTNESVGVSGKISGTISGLRGRNIKLTYGKFTDLDCDFDLSGLPAIKDAFIYIGVNSLNTNSSDFQDLDLPGKKRLMVPPTINKLGNISFDGSFTGFVTDFVAYGKIETEMGNMKVDVSLRPEEKNRFRVKGLVKGSNINLGELSGNSDLLGKLSMETNLDGYASSVSRFAGTLTGKIDSVEVNRYLYRNITVNGLFTEKTWDGSVNISDRNIKMDLLGMFDFSKELPEFDFTLNLAESNLYNLNFDKADSTARLSALLTANFRGNNIDNLFGEIKLLNSTFRKYNNQLDLYNFSLKAFTENSKPAISLRTDYVDADLRGYYNFGEISSVLKRALASMMPARFSAPESGKGEVRNGFTIALNFKNTDKLNNFFRTGLLLADKSRLTGSFFPDSIIKINLSSKMLSFRNNVFNDFTLNSGFADSLFTADLNSTTLSILGIADLRGFTMKFNTDPDNFLFRINWDSREEVLNKGNFTARGFLLRKEEGSEGAMLRISIDSSAIYTDNNLWEISRSTVTIDSNAVNIDRFIARNKDNYYIIDGDISENPADTMKLAINGFDLGLLNSAAEKGDKNESPGLNLDIHGIIDGNILVSNALKSPLIESSINVRNFSFLGGNYGNISIGSVWNASRKVADINVSNNLNGAKNLDIAGYYDPSSKKIRLDAIMSKLPVDALNPLLSFFASDVTGTVSGKVNLTGEISKPVLTGALMAENTSMKIDYLQTKYKINDSIRFDRDGIKFRNITLTDERGKTATLTGAVNHKYFKDYTTNLSINLNDCLVFNTQAKDNEMFYGTAYATGLTTIRSGPNSLSFDISATTGKNTMVFIPLNSGLSVSEYSFVTFVNQDTTKDGEKKAQVLPSGTSGTQLVLNIDLNVTPEAEIQLLIDPKAGDVIKGRGEGNLNMNLNAAGDFKITGDYTIEEGDYLFTLGNIFNKRFDVESGGMLTFNGDLENAEIDLRASYKNLKASLAPILPDLGDSRYNERIPVEPQIHLSGKLFNPFVKFDIYLPNADEETRTYLKNMITSEEELSRQFLFLLVMNSFYTDNSMANKPNTTSAGTSAMAATTTEMVSNQLSNWLSQISNDFDVGFNYRPGYGVNSQEVQVALSTQLLNDRVLINGNFGTGDAANYYGYPITGDFDVEYKITEKIRFKVFNRFNNNIYTGRGVPYTQGLGLFYKQDFNKFSDLFRKKEKSEPRKEDEITIEE